MTRCASVALPGWQRFAGGVQACAKRREYSCGGCGTGWGLPVAVGLWVSTSHRTNTMCIARREGCFYFMSQGIDVDTLLFSNMEPHRGSGRQFSFERNPLVGSMLVDSIGSTYIYIYIKYMCISFLLLIFTPVSWPGRVLAGHERSGSRGQAPCDTIGRPRNMGSCGNSSVV